MEIDDIKTLFDYNYWATEKIFKKTANLSAEQFKSQTPCSHGSLLSTRLNMNYLSLTSNLSICRLCGDYQTLFA